MTRTNMSLDGQWDFIPDLDQQLSAENLNQETARTITVPGPWQTQFDDLQGKGGTAWYRRSFTPPSTDLADAVYVLHFGAVDYHATVWLNGTQLGEHKGGYLPFEVECTGLKTNEANELIVRVVDPGDNSSTFAEYPFDQIPHGKQSWYGPIGGIWQSVYVEARSATYIERLKVTPQVDQEQATLELFLSQPLSQAGDLSVTLTAPDGATSEQTFALTAGEAQQTFTLPVAAPQLWDIDQPNIYRLKASLGDDALETTFGMRTVGIENGAITINGRPIYLRSALDQDYYPLGQYTVFSDEELDDQFAKAKQLGLNCLRIHIKITDPRYYDAADRAGVVIWTELPNWELLTPETKERARETLIGMVERDWNHPSIIIWTIINENWGTDLMFNQDHREWLSQTFDFMKQLDPTRLVVDNSACHGNFHVVSDLDDFHVYYSVPDHYRKWKRWVDVFAERPDWSYAFDYENFENWRTYNRDPWAPIDREKQPEVRRSKKEPLIVSEFGNWGLPDVANLYKGYGGEPWWFETGFDRGAGEVYPHGVEERFKLFHLDNVFGNYANLAKASQRMQHVAMKYEIEQMRRHAGIVGYVITEFTDVNWECNGLLDLCRNPKAYHEVFKQVNADDVIVPLWERTVFWEGEQVEIGMLVSQFSTLDLNGSTLNWSITGVDGLSGSISGVAPTFAGVVNAGTVSFEVPALTQSVQVTLELNLTSSNGDVVARNQEVLYFFPRTLSTAASNGPVVYATDTVLQDKLAELGYTISQERTAADLVVTATLTDELRWYAQQGGRVLWLAESSKSQQSAADGLWIHQRDGSRWQGDWASNFNWIRNDTIFKDIPTGNVLDFAFADLIPNHVITGLSARDYADEVHAGLTVGWLHNTVGLVAERRLGVGRLLVSTFNLSDYLGSNPVATVMLHDLVRHAAR